MYRVPKFMSEHIKRNRKFLKKRVAEYNPCLKLTFGLVNQSEHALNLIVTHEDGSDDYNH